MVTPLETPGAKVQFRCYAACYSASANAVFRGYRAGYRLSKAGAASASATKKKARRSGRAGVDCSTGKGWQSLQKAHPPEPPPFSSPYIGGEENFGVELLRKRRKRRISAFHCCHNQPSLQPSTPRATSPVIASLVREVRLSVGHVSFAAPADTAASSSMHGRSGGAPGLPIVPSLNMGRSASNTTR